MKIIIIRGAINSGKTTTTGLLYSELVNIAEIEHIFNGETVNTNSLKYNKRGDVIDFTSVLIVGKIKIGIVSAGDVAKDLKHNIKIMISLNIDILICCARSVNKKGSAYKMIIDDYSKEHKAIKEIWTEYSEKFDQKKDIKKKTVNEIINLIKE
jgi:adenylate kinase family enzyme